MRVGEHPVQPVRARGFMEGGASWRTGSGRVPTEASEPIPRGARALAKNSQGFTLLELLVTITIMMVLASVAMPLSKVSGKRTKEMELRQELRTIRTALDTFKMDWNREGDVLMGPLCVKNKLTCKDFTGSSGYPKSLDVLLKVTLSGDEATTKGLTVKRYLRKIPMDPLTGKIDWKLRCYADPPDTMSWCGDDVYDISSSSPDTGLDGTNYRDW